MVETRVFNGFTDVNNTKDTWCVTEWTPTYSRDMWFSRDEWDCEITFTKKAQPIQAGDTVKWLTSDVEYRVVAVDGDVLWVIARNNTSRYTVHADQVTKI